MTTINTYGVKSLRRIQMAKEVTAGTQIKATSLWRGEGTLQDDTTIVRPVEDIGILMGTDRTYVPSKGGTITLADTPATFEQLPYLAEMGIKGVYTGASDGAGSGKIYTYPFPTTTQRSINPYSFENGDNAGAYFTPYGICESMKLAGKYGEGVMMGGVIKTRTVSRNTLTGTGIAFDNANHITDSNNGLAVFTAGMSIFVNGTASNNGTFTVTVSTAGQLTVTETTATEIAGGSVTIEQTFTATTIPAVNTMNFNQSKLYIDNAGGSFGTTQITGSFLDFAWDYVTGWKVQQTGDGRLDFTFVKSTMPEGTLKITFEHENAAKAEREKWLSQSPRLIRILNQGIALNTAGTTYTYYTMILDIPGTYTSFSAFNDDKGDDTVAAELKHAYNATAATTGQLIIVNQLASLP